MSPQQGFDREHDLTQVQRQLKDSYWKIIHCSYELFNLQPISDPNSEPSNDVKKQVKKRDGFCCLCCGENNRRLLEIDYINPNYHGGKHVLKNLQTLCRTCKQLKGAREIDFHKHQTSLTTPLPNFPDLKLSNLTLMQARDKRQWEKMLRRSINFFYLCAAVKSIKIGKEWEYWYDWEVFLFTSNNPSWLIPHLKKSVREIQQVRSNKGLTGPKEIMITAPGFDIVEPITG